MAELKTGWKALILALTYALGLGTNAMIDLDMTPEINETVEMPDEVVIDPVTGDVSLIYKGQYLECYTDDQGVFRCKGPVWENFE